MPIGRSQTLRQAIEEQAKRLGSQLVGVTSPDPPAHIDVYRSWLSASLHGEMGYLATERALQRRADPRQILPECRSILVLGIRYPSPLTGATNNLLIPTPSSAEVSSPQLIPAPSPAQITPPHLIPTPSSAQVTPPIRPITFAPKTSPLASTMIPAPSSAQASPLTGRVASYAWGADYHEVLADRFSTLVAAIETQVEAPVPNRWYTDTGPILERDLAQRAGLGWIGKNTCLINPRQGSYFFLAEILLGLELEPDAPFTFDYCGTCTRCLDACPTGCILPNRTIDSRRCISYLTIELKGAIPLELRSSIGDWVFGCDLCQQVCPWNVRFASMDGDPAFDPRPGAPRPELIPELFLSSQAFNQKFKGSPIKRARRGGYLRNVTVALGNKGDPVAVPALAQVIFSEPERLVRGHAAWALGRIGDMRVKQTLNAALLTEKDAYVLEEIQHALDAVER